MTDTNHGTYAVVVALIVFFVSSAVAAKPWAKPKPDARIAALAQREARLRTDARLVKQIDDQRLAAHTIALEQRQVLIASAKSRSLQVARTQAAASPSVRVVNLPPLTITRTS